MIKLATALAAIMLTMIVVMATFPSSANAGSRGPESLYWTLELDRAASAGNEISKLEI